MRRCATAIGVLALAATTGCGHQARPLTGKPIDIGGATPAVASDYKRPLGAAVQNAFAQSDPAYRHLLVEKFTSVTPENSLKWVNVEPERGKFDFSETDAIVDFAQKTHKRVRGHPLIWDQQLPGWLTDHSWARQELAAVVTNHIRTIVSRYRGKVAEWDVVNEPLDDNGKLTQNLFLKTLGPSYIALAFRVAHTADPHARLFVNEIAAEQGAKLNALVDLVRGLKRSGVPIDAVGIQNHTTAKNFPDRTQLESDFATFKQLGLDTAITEMDVDDTGSDVQTQADAFRAAAEACVAASNCTGLTTWGITDDHSWLGGDKHALLYEAGGAPKPAAAAVLDVLSRR